MRSCMTLTEKQKKFLAQNAIKRYFPGTPKPLERQIIRQAKRQFMPDYSPVKREQHSRHAGGKGASWTDFIIGEAREMTGQEPHKIKRSRLSSILQKIYTF